LIPVMHMAGLEQPPRRLYCSVDTYDRNGTWS
jgi:hypothetical protein